MFFQLSSQATSIIAVVFNPLTYIIVFCLGLIMVKGCKGAFGQVFGILFIVLSLLCGIPVLIFGLLIVYG